MIRDYMPPETEGMRRWCLHQIEHLPRFAAALGICQTEAAVFIADCHALLGAIHARNPSHALRNLARIKRTSLRRRVANLVARADFPEEAGKGMRWVLPSFGEGVAENINAKKVYSNSITISVQAHFSPHDCNIARLDPRRRRP